MNAIVAAGLKYLLYFILLYGTLTGISLIPQVGALANNIYRQPTEVILKGLLPKAYLKLKADQNKPDVIRIEYASKKELKEQSRLSRVNGRPLQVKGKITEVKFYNLFLSFYLFFVALMVLSPIPKKEMLIGLTAGTLLFYLFTVFKVTLSLIVLFNQPDAQIYQTNKVLLDIYSGILYYLTLGVKILVVLLLWMLFAFRKNNWQQLLQ